MCLWCAPADAACTLPNVLTNGQVADASKVMDDLNAAASCADAATTPSGTPTPGSIAVFSSSKSIGSGDLTGDVTTSGGTATVLAPTGVTPGSYANPNITVDAKGRITSVGSGAGAGGSAWWFSPPLASSLSLVSGDGTSLILTDDSDVGLMFDAGAAVSGDKLRGAVRTLTDKTKDWDLIARIDTVLTTTNFSYFGILLYDSVSGKAIMLKVDNANAINNTRYTSLGTFSAGGTNVAINGVTDVKWFRAQRVGANVTYSFSADGKSWITLVTESVTAFLANPPDKLGIAVGYNRAGGPTIKGSCPYFSLTGPGV
jgi:hypothetical protein